MGTSDRRVQRTRQLLHEALLALILEQDYDSITIQQIIDRANIGRATFYAHYHDKDDLLQSGFRQLLSEFEHYLRNFSHYEEGPWKMIRALLQHAEEQRQIYGALARQQGGAGLLGYIKKHLIVMMRNHFQALSEQHAPLTIAPGALAEYLAGGFMALLQWWLLQPQPEPAEQIYQGYRQLVEPGLLTTLGFSVPPYGPGSREKV